MVFGLGLGQNMADQADFAHTAFEGYIGEAAAGRAQLECGNTVEFGAGKLERPLSSLHATT